MTRITPWVPPAVAVLAVVLLGGGDTGVVVAVVGLGVVAGWALHSIDVAQLRRLTRAATGWAGDRSAAAPPATGAAAWRELSAAVQALGQQLQEARGELRSVVPWTEQLVAALDEPALVFDRDRRLLAANGAARAELRLPTDGDPPTALTSLGSAAAAGAVDEAFASGRAVAVDDRRGERELRVTASPLDEHVVVVVADHTRERQVEALRRDFVTNASHELKTPAAAIATLTDALRVAPDDRREQLLDRLEEEALRLSRMVRDLLDLSRLDDGPGGAETAPVDLVPLVTAAVASLGPVAEEAQVTIEVDVPPRAVVVGVERELRLAVDNLVANAVQYNRPGGTVSVTLAPDDGEQVLVVADTGIGIPQSALPRVFERFYRVDVARSRERGGTGLGLSLVRNAVHRHGGRVAIQSLLGVGTTVTVRLPVGGRA